MKTLLTDEDVLQLAYDYLMYPNPNPDSIPAHAEKMGMEFDESSGLWDDKDGVWEMVKIPKP